MGKLKNGKATGGDEINGEVIKGRGDRVVDWIWRLCNMSFENGVVLEDWISAVIVPPCKGKGDRNETMMERCFWREGIKAIKLGEVDRRIAREMVILLLTKYLWECVRKVNK